MPSYKLYYFNIRGFAEICRLIFAAAGEKYDDVRYEYEQWPLHKPEMPLGQLPVLEVDGVKLPQSMSISRFLAKQFHLAGRDNLEQAKVDAVVDTINDAVKSFVVTRMEKDEVKQQEITKKFFADELPKHLGNLEVLQQMYGDGGVFFVGKQLTWADLLFQVVSETFLSMDSSVLNEHPRLNQNRTEVESQPRLAEYLKNRPKTQY